MVNPATLEESVQSLPMILPHEFCLALWRRGEATFKRCLFGHLTQDQVKQYWDHLETHADWFKNHPAQSWPHRERLAGVATYGDEVQAYKNSECGVVSILAWTAEFCFKSDPLLRYYAISVWSEHHESPNTYSDAVQFVVDSFRRLADPRVDWPWTQHGYLVAFTAAQGDLKWICERMGGIHNYRRNDFCSRCKCTKTSESVCHTLTNFTENEDAFEKHSYADIDMAATYSPLFSLPLTMERVQHDVAHSQLLGTGKTSNGSLVCKV